MVGMVERWRLESMSLRNFPRSCVGDDLMKWIMEGLRLTITILLMGLTLTPSRSSETFAIIKRNVKLVVACFYVPALLGSTTLSSRVDHDTHLRFSWAYWLQQVNTQTKSSGRTSVEVANQSLRRDDFVVLNPCVSAFLVPFTFLRLGIPDDKMKEDIVFDMLLPRRVIWAQAVSLAIHCLHYGEFIEHWGGDSSK